MKKLVFLLTLTFLYQITEAQVCHALFGYDIIGSVANFRDSSENYNGYNYQWDFGDTTTGSGSSVQHIYSYSGTFNVCLTIYDSSVGCFDKHCESITINASCHANFIKQTIGKIVNFQDASFNYFGNSYFWNFGDGQTSNVKNPQHTYSSVGTYSVCLTISDPATNCSDTRCMNVYIFDCQAFFTTLITGAVVSFSDSSKHYSGNISQWTFGDGNSGSGKYVQHTYSSSGVYNVCLSISDPSNGCSDSYCDSIVVFTDCKAEFNYSISGYNVSFTDASVNYTANNYLWNFGDGQTGSGKNLQHTYAGTGTYHVTLTIIDTTINCLDSFSQDIVIYNNNYFSGRVFAGSNLINYGTVYLIVFNEIDSTLRAIDSASIDHRGEFSFIQFPYGMYLVKAALTPNSPYYSNYIPTYYGNVLFWNQATYLNLTHYPDTSVINLISGNNPGGPGFIGGKTSQGANAVLDPGDPIESVLILLLDEMDNPILYDYSDAIGSFDFDDIALGTYKIYAEVLGKTTFPATVTIDETKSSISDVKIIIGKKEVTNYIGEDNFEFIRNVSDIYPNPGKDEMFLDITVIKHTNITVTIYSELGEFVHSSNFELGKGSHMVPFNSQKWASGVYYLQISSSEGDQVFRKYVKF